MSPNRPEPNAMPQPDGRSFPWFCPRCRKKEVWQVTIPYCARGVREGRSVTVDIRRLTVPRCRNCGELLFDYSADEQVLEALDAQAATDDSDANGAAPVGGTKKTQKAQKRFVMPIPQPIANQQTVGNIGLFYVCYRLSRMGWNVMPTARNAKGIDILIYSQNASQKRTIQVKTLSKGSPVPLSNKLDHLFADFVVVCRHVIQEIPECFVLTPAEVRKLVHRGEKNGKVSFWLQPRDYATDEFREKWERIGSGLPS